MHLSRICVFAGSSPGADPLYAQAAVELGRTLAQRGVGVVYGGGKVGLMGAVADAALEAGGEVIGVLPEALDRVEVGHRGLTELHVVSSMHERKAMMAELADAFIALPGGLGTFEEVLEVSTWTQLGIHAKPVGLLSAGGFYDDLDRLLDHAVRERFLRVEHRQQLLIGNQIDQLLKELSLWQPATVGKWQDAAERDVTLAPRGPLLGTSSVVVREGKVLLGCRRSSHGDGEWSFPGGKVDPGEEPAEAAGRELTEETGLIPARVTPITWTHDLFADRGLHYVTLHHLVEATGEPVTQEPEKIAEWGWFPWDSLPDPLFPPVAELLKTGWRPPSREGSSRRA
ncbi:TIGR00730 family Rossman fold protein [Nesterenkonia alba]|uniref:TIGR00730 family Rossman fold protein n=1 Tax=Nesterenkonia alba TaxID=515814 RepID=UPI0003B38374|nr:TIGR00730 family Rossman fold protein [Nesterenkonia alba]